MNCDTCREGLSARLDGEELPLDAAAVDAHLAGCAGCQAFAVPDLSTSILARVPVAATGRRAAPQPREWPRYVLLTVALTQLVLALPALIMGDDPGASVHVARELGSWDVALSVGLLVAAWQPRRAAGLLPFAAALAGAMLMTAVLDLVAGRTLAQTEAHHLLDLIGLAALWVLAQPAGHISRPTRRTALPA
jgi:predicted anti-sigma-YlaC factor YlaD